MRKKEWGKREKGRWETGEKWEKQWEKNWENIGRKKGRKKRQQNWGKMEKRGKEGKQSIGEKIRRKIGEKN